MKMTLIRNNKNSLKPREIREETGDEEGKRGLVMIPNIPEFTHKFNKIAAKHKFKTTNKADNKVRNLVAKAKTPLGEKNANVVYNIPCKCKEFGYTGETYRMWGTRKRYWNRSVDCMGFRIWLKVDMDRIT